MKVYLKWLLRNKLQRNCGIVITYAKWKLVEGMHEKIESRKILTLFSSRVNNFIARAVHNTLSNSNKSKILLCNFNAYVTCNLAISTKSMWLFFKKAWAKFVAKCRPTNLAVCKRGQHNQVCFYCFARWRQAKIRTSTRGTLDFQVGQITIMAID